MRLKVDKEVDALYLRFSEADVIESEEIQPGIIFDFDEQGHVVAIEILSLSERTDIEKLYSFQFETT